MSTTERTLSWILKGGLLITPFLVLVVTRWLYFPFITGKNFAFRILVELLAVVWVYAALKFPRFRPRSSALAWAVIAFIAVMGLATIFSLSPYRSFWSSFERMEGYVGLLHLFLYFFLLVSVFKSERDWTVFFHVSLAASAILSLYGLFQLFGAFDIHQGRTRIDATLGNATYFAAYLLFHLFFLIWFFLRTRNGYIRAAYAAAFLLESVMLYYTATRGAMLGMLGGLVVLAVLLAILAAGRLRRWALGGLAAVALVVGLFFLVRNADFVKRSPVLDRFATISLQETTTKSRFTIWQMAFRGWQERPILGWGQENFVYVFSKYYEPSLWRQEPWFDRAHNVFLDWLTAGGIAGLAAYLSMYGAAIAAGIAAYRRRALDAVSFSILVSLLAAHFFQNLFVFDNLTSYLLFFAVLAYVHTVSERTAAANAAAPRRPPRRSALPLLVSIGATVAAGAMFLVALYFWNVKPILAAKATIDALGTARLSPPAGRVEALIANFRKGIELNTFGTTELREQISQVVPNVLGDSSLANQDKVKFVTYAVEELEAQHRAAPEDMRAKAFLATIYLSAGRPTDAVAIVNEALALSDRRQQFYFIAAEAYLNAGQESQAISALERAYDLDRSYPEALINLATVLILTGRDRDAAPLLREFYGTTTPAEERFGQAYTQRGDLERAILVWEAVVRRAPHGAPGRANLGVLYARVGRAAEAIAELEEAIRLEPGFKTQGEAIVQQIRSGEIR